MSASALGISVQTTPETGTTTAAPAPADAAAATDPDKIVCKSMAPLVGTRIGTRRICQTQGVWDAQHRQNQDDITREQDRGNLFHTN
jgi:hypothetical protein